MINSHNAFCAVAFFIRKEERALLENFIISANSILPIFVIIILGYFLRRINLLNSAFLDVSDKLVFKCALPAMLFYNVATTEFKTAFNGRLAAFCVIGTFLVFLLMTLLITPAIKRKDVRGAVIQGIYRSNFAILGVPLAANLFGAEGSTAASLVIPFLIPVYNVFAVIILAMNMPDGKKDGAGLVWKIIKNVITNPLIISVVLAIPFSLGYLSMPTVLDKTVGYLSDLSTPLALLSLGASFRFADIKGNISYSIFATIMKIAVCPLVFCTIAVLMGFRGVELGIIFIAFGAPTAVSSYIMARQMKSNSIVASQIILLTTLLCSVTMLIGSTILKNLGLF